MIKKYIVTLIAVLLIFAPARAFAVEHDNTFDDGTGEGTYNEVPWQEEAPYDNTYEEPVYGENNQNDDYQNNGTVEEDTWNDGYNGTDDNTYNDGYNDQYTEPEVYEEPYTEPYTEPYIEPEAETYEEPYTEPYTEPEVYEEPYTETEVEPEPEEDEELSINAVKGEGYTVSGVVTGEEQPAENVKLLLSTENDSIETASNENGEFTFEDVANGTYKLSAADSETIEASAEPVEVTVENRNKLGYEIAVTPIEAAPVKEESPEETEEVEEPEEELPVEEAETEQQSSDASGGMSPFELILIAGGTILLLAAIGIALFRKLSAR